MINDRAQIAKTLYDKIKASDAPFVDFRFTDPNGVWHQITFKTSALDEKLLYDGIMFDGSCIPGWKKVHNSDMCLKPEITKADLDQISGDSFILICNAYDPEENAPYQHDPRSIAEKAETYMRASGYADTAYFGPEPEFFVFDSADFFTSSHESFVFLQGREVKKSGSIMPHRPTHGGGYAPCIPSDTGYALRAQMCHNLEAMGIEVEKHHHEVASNQHELGFKFDTLINTCDILQLFKYTVKNTAEEFEQTATFMPKPVFGDNGSGMHVHQSLWKEGKNLFKGDQYAGLSETALYYIGGILKHARALNAFTNPTTNSYKRLVAGYEAPVFKAYSASNRSVAVRIPHVSSSDARRIEVRFPDPTANPYLALAAMLMAGLDGIENKIHPGEATDQDLFAESEKLHHVETLAPNLTQALDALRDNHDFLLKGNVFTKAQIDTYIELKRADVERLNMIPHPIEYEMYYRA